METLFVVNDPGSRVYWLYLLSALLFVCVFSWCQRESSLSRLTPLFSIKLWWSHSSLLDLQWFTANAVVKMALIVPFLGVQYGLALWINGICYRYLGEGNFLRWEQLNVSVFFTLCYFFLDDFSRFYLHSLFHRIPWLWRFHSVHHSAEVLTPLTFYRIHTIELFLNSLRSLLVAGLVSGVFIYLFSADISFIDILGVNVFTFLFNLLGANLRHSPVWIGFGVFERLFISPAQHQIHHSDDHRHINKNMGSTLAVWDGLFGSLLLSKGEQVGGFGLGGNKKVPNWISQIKGID